MSVLIFVFFFVLDFIRMYNIIDDLVACGFERSLFASLIIPCFYLLFLINFRILFIFAETPLVRLMGLLRACVDLAHTRTGIFLTKLSHINQTKGSCNSKTHDLSYTNHYRSIQICNFVASGGTFHIY